MIQIKLVSASDLELDKIEFIECKIFFEFPRSYLNKPSILYILIYTKKNH